MNQCYLVVHNGQRSPRTRKIPGRRFSGTGDFRSSETITNNLAVDDNRHYNFSVNTLLHYVRCRSTGLLLCHVARFH